jgi:hypothetical protein
LANFLKSDYFIGFKVMAINLVLDGKLFFEYRDTNLLIKGHILIGFGPF